MSHNNYIVSFRIRKKTFGLYTTTFQDLGLTPWPCRPENFSKLISKTFPARRKWKLTKQEQGKPSVVREEMWADKLAQTQWQAQRCPELPSLHSSTPGSSVVWTLYQSDRSLAHSQMLPGTASHVATTTAVDRSGCWYAKEDPDTACPATTSHAHYRLCMALYKKAISKVQSVAAIWDHTVLSATQHRWKCLTLILARWASTQFTYPWWMKGWVDLDVGYIQRWFTYWKTAI